MLEKQQSIAKKKTKSREKSRNKKKTSANAQVLISR